MRRTFSIKEVGLKKSNYFSDYPQAKSFAFCFIFFSKSQIKRFGDLAYTLETLSLALSSPAFFYKLLATVFSSHCGFSVIVNKV